MDTFISYRLIVMSTPCRVAKESLLSMALSTEFCIVITPSPDNPKRSRGDEPLRQESWETDGKS